MPTPFAALKRLLVSSSERLPFAPWTAGYGPSLHQSVTTLRFRQQRIVRNLYYVQMICCFTTVKNCYPSIVSNPELLDG